MMKYLLIVKLFVFYATAFGALAGGRPNAFSEGQNAFAGVVNPANAVWIADRIDIGGFWVHQNSNLNNHDNNPFFSPGKIDLTYRSKDIFAADAAIHKQFKMEMSSKVFGLVHMIREFFGHGNFLRVVFIRQAFSLRFFILAYLGSSGRRRRPDDPRLSNTRTSS